MNYLDVELPIVEVTRNVDFRLYDLVCRYTAECIIIHLIAKHETRIIFTYYSFLTIAHKLFTANDAVCGRVFIFPERLNNVIRVRFWASNPVLIIHIDDIHVLQPYTGELNDPAWLPNYPQTAVFLSKTTLTSIFDMFCVGNHVFGLEVSDGKIVGLYSADNLCYLHVGFGSNGPKTMLQFNVHQTRSIIRVAGHESMGISTDHTYLYVVEVIDQTHQVTFITRISPIIVP